MLGDAGCSLAHTSHLQNCYYIIQSCIEKDFRAFFKECMHRDLADLVRSHNMYSHFSCDQSSFLALKSFFNRAPHEGWLPSRCLVRSHWAPHGHETFLPCWEEGLLPHSYFFPFCQAQCRFWGGCHKTQAPAGQVLLGLRWKAACSVCPKAAAGMAAPNAGASLAQGTANPGILLEMKNLFLTFWYFSRSRV